MLSNHEKTVWFLWENHQILNWMSKIQFTQKHNKIKSASIFYLEQAQLSHWIRVLQILNYALNRLTLEKVIHWFLTDTFCFMWCISWCFVDFIFSYFDLILLIFWTSNFNFISCWFESFYVSISKICTFLSTSHTICTDMLIIHCTFFSKAVFLFFMRFLTLLWFLTRLWKHCI